MYYGAIGYFPRAIKELTRLTEYGAAKHGFPLELQSYRQPGYTKEGYTDAVARHLVGLALEGEINHADADMFHRTQLAWNAMAALELFLTEQEKKSNGAPATA